jgi:hypothetical protein
MKKIIVAVAIVFFTFTLGCGGTSSGGGGGDTPVDVSGNWSGEWINKETGFMTYWIMTISQNGSSLTGSISCSGNGSGGPYDLTGTASTSSISISIEFSGCQVNLDSDVSDDTIDGSGTRSGTCGCMGSGDSFYWMGTSP